MKSAGTRTHLTDSGLCSSRANDNLEHPRVPAILPPVPLALALLQPHPERVPPVGVGISVSIRICVSTVPLSVLALLYDSRHDLHDRLSHRPVGVEFELDFG